MKRLILLLVTCNAFVSAACAYNVSFDIEADLLKTSAGAAVPTTGICMLVASTTNATFGTINSGASITTGSFIDGGDDQILFKMNLSTNATAGVFGELPTINTANFSASLDGGDRLILYWFPTLTITATTIPNTLTSYGAFRIDTTQDGGQAWTMPAVTAPNYRLYFKTTDATIFTGGTHLPTESLATLTTSPIPEPSTYAMVLLTAGALCGVSMLRKRLRC